MQKRPCRACRKQFEPSAQTPKQCFCADERCQRERRRRWQKNKRRRDADYRDNDRRAQRTWAEQHPEYWQAYRREHPEYAEHNRLAQRDRDRQRRGAGHSGSESVLVNEDASASFLPLQSGIYELKPVIPAGSAVLANEDVWQVQIAVMPRS
jgi:hypothetical protein